MPKIWAVCAGRYAKAKLSIIKKTSQSSNFVWMFLNSASWIPATARSTRIANTGLGEQTRFGKQMLWHTTLCRWGLSRMSRILPQIIEMSENTTTIFAFSNYLLVVHLSKYSIQMKLNKGGWFFFSPICLSTLFTTVSIFASWQEMGKVHFESPFSSCSQFLVY